MGRCYGSTTVGERGQVVIPIEARKELGLEPGAKLVVFATGKHRGLILMPAEMLARFVAEAISELTQLEQIAKADVQDT